MKALQQLLLLLGVGLVLAAAAADPPLAAAAAVTAAAQPTAYDSASECSHYVGSGCEECQLLRTIKEDHVMYAPQVELSSLPEDPTAVQAAAAATAAGAATESYLAAADADSSLQKARVLAAEPGTAPSQQAPQAASTQGVYGKDVYGQNGPKQYSGYNQPPGYKPYAGYAPKPYPGPNPGQYGGYKPGQYAGYGQRPNPGYGQAHDAGRFIKYGSNHYAGAVGQQPGQQYAGYGQGQYAAGSPDQYGAGKQYAGYGQGQYGGAGKQYAGYGQEQYAGAGKQYPGYGQDQYRGTGKQYAGYGEGQYGGAGTQYAGYGQGQDSGGQQYAGYGQDQYKGGHYGGYDQQQQYAGSSPEQYTGYSGQGQYAGTTGQDHNADDYQHGGWGKYGYRGPHGFHGRYTSQVDDWTCTMCNEAENYQLWDLPDNSTKCGCKAGFGIFPTYPNQTCSHGWQWQYVKHFECKTCPAGSVPFLPGSNLELVWDGSKWTIRLMKAPRSSAVLAHGSGFVDGSDAGSDEDGAGNEGVAVFGDGGYTQAAYSSEQDDEKLVEPPVCPGQCVECPEGSFPSQDGTKCLSGPSPPPSPSPSPGPSPSPTPSPSPSPSPPPPGAYCCGGAQCTTPVPEPPNSLPEPSAGSKSVARTRTRRPHKGRVISAPPGTASVQQIVGIGSQSPVEQDFPPMAGVLDVCAAYPRIPLGTPPFTGVQKNQPYMIFYVADLDPETTCEFTEGVPGVVVCTGTQLAAFMLLTAEHCMSQTSMAALTGCPNAEVFDALACYDYNPQQGDGSTLDWEGCPDENLFYAVGMSYNNRIAAGGSFQPAKRPYDQGIVFTDQPRDGPYFQYNYIENVETAKATNKWQATSYANPGDASAQPPQCGCAACPGMTCNLARSGPNTGSLKPDPNAQGNMAYSPSLEACGAGGACLTMNGDACCIGTSSYSYAQGTSACSGNCENYYSGISKDRPLENLWKAIAVELPKFTE